MSNNPLDPFDPLAALEASGKRVPNHLHPGGGTHWGENLEVPVSLDVLAEGPAHDETAAQWILRAAAAARAADTRPLFPVRPVRSESKHYAPPPPLPYPFDGTNPLADMAIARLALPAKNANDANRRVSAAMMLNREYETRHHRPLSLSNALKFWWIAARRLLDVATALDRPGLSPNALRMRALRPVAHDFATAKGIPPSARAAAIEAAGVPMPRNKKGKPTDDSTGPQNFVL